MELPAVAKSFYAFCKKCDAERYHKVLAHTSAKSAKIKCEVCGSTKSFKPDSPTKKSGEPTKRASAASKSETKKRLEHEAAYNDLSAKFGSQTPVKYTIKDQFQKDAVIDHPKFGLGFVMLSTELKIDVVFKDAVRSLVHRRP